MEISELKTIIIDQKNIIPPADSIVFRDCFLKADEIMSHSLISVITGLRRSGKSHFLYHLRTRQQENDYFFNFEDDRLATFTVADFDKLLAAFMALYGKQSTVFFDEIQNIPEWERFIRRLHDHGYKIILTGSNAALLSKELGTKLTGRYLAYEVYPCSFSEFLQFHNITVDLNALGTQQKAILDQSFERYSEKGGLPGAFLLNIPDYLHTLYENILYRDIITRYSITSVKSFKELVYYLASNIAKDTSYSNLAKLIGLSSPTTVAEYCNYLENSYLCFFINRFSYSLKNQIGYHKKVYFIDAALAKVVGFRMSEDRGRLLENIVFLELKRRYKNIYFHSEKKECDFVIKENMTITRAYQVTMSLQEMNTRERELAGIQEAMATYDLNEGVIITQSEEMTMTITQGDRNKTIHIIPIWKWLLDK